VHNNARVKKRKEGEKERKSQIKFKQTVDKIRAIYAIYIIIIIPTTQIEVVIKK
jgi:hypothetical protein